jgi:malate dehydrogenase (oxaloacetate-decarboxylating)(NADP+)
MMDDSFKERSLRYHMDPAPGKLEIRPTKPMANARDLAMAYSPGVAYACGYIVKNPTDVDKVTARGNLVAVVTNGTAVLGLGDIGPLASKPVMEGKAVLFKKFANIDVFDIEIDEPDTDKLIDTIASLEPTFGGINLEDIKAPECFLIEQKLRERMKIPVFHDDQHGTAIVSAAAIYNGLRIVKKKIEDIKIVVTGAGAASIACVNLLITMGLCKKNVRMIDRNGVIYKGRAVGMNPWKEDYAVETSDRTLDDAIVNADLFLGLSGPGILKASMVKKMAPNPLILAMSNPTPEIMPELAKAARPDAIIATGRSDYPNQVNNVLCFPFIFRGALDCGATTINDEMKKACVKAIADLAHREVSPVVAEAYAGEDLKFGPEYLIPKPFDPRLIEEVPLAVVKAAMASGVATRPIEDLQAYRNKLHSYVNRSQLFMQPMIERAKKNPPKIAYAEGENDDVLRAMQGIVDEKIATPILIGRPAVINRKIKEMNLRLNPGVDLQIFDPTDDAHHKKYWLYYHNHVGRSGVSVETAKNSVHTDNTVLATIMVALGDADGLICGKSGRYDHHLTKIRSIIPPRNDNSSISSICILLLDDGPLFLADAFINVNPTEEQIVDITKDAISFVKGCGVIPKVALLSHSNYGTYDDHSAHKMKRAAEKLRIEITNIEIDGEMHAMSALNEALRETTCNDTNITGRANVLIMPNMDAASIALGLIRSLTNARLVGPFVNGLEKPAHILIPSVSGRGILNTTAMMGSEYFTINDHLEAES